MKSQSPAHLTTNGPREEEEEQRRLRRGNEAEEGSQRVLIATRRWRKRLTVKCGQIKDDSITRVQYVALDQSSFNRVMMLKVGLEAVRRGWVGRPGTQPKICFKKGRMGLQLEGSRGEFLL